uniref:Uncharacterized protein n=1 Tax=Ascaris lumbricoides TaxID=6252 RepID=A0A0M3IF15_ASCLU
MGRIPVCQLVFRNIQAQRSRERTSGKLGVQASGSSANEAAGCVKCEHQRPPQLPPGSYHTPSGQVAS